MKRLNYFLRSPAIDGATYYEPLLQHLLQAWAGKAMTLVLDTSMLWDQYCLIEVCLAWGGRSIVLVQSLAHGSTSVAFDAYCPVLETVAALLPPDVMVLFLADRGFVRVASPLEIHGDLMRWLNDTDWNWAIRAKSDLVVTLNSGLQQSVSALLPPPGQAYLHHNVQVIGDIKCHLANAHWPQAKEAWTVLTRRTPSLQTFAEYGQRFGGIEPHFKDYKSATFDLTRSHIRDPEDLGCLLMLIAAAQPFAIQIGSSAVCAN